MNYVTDDFRLNRVGMQNLCELAGIPDAGSGPARRYDERSFADRRNEIVDIVAKGAVVWVVFRLFDWRHAHRILLGAAQTGAPVDLLELGVFRVKVQRIAEAWFMNDELAITQRYLLSWGLRPRGL